jgi:hypothetical protein
MMDDADRLNAQAAHLYAAVYWIGLITAAAVAGNHLAVCIALGGVVLGMGSHIAAWGKPDSLLAHGLCIACNLVAVFATAVLLIGYFG